MSRLRQKTHQYTREQGVQSLVPELFLVVFTSSKLAQYFAFVYCLAQGGCEL